MLLKMTGFLRQIALLLSVLIFLAYLGFSLDPAGFKEDLQVKLNLKEKSLSEKYYESFKDYIYYIFQSIINLKEKAVKVSDDIVNLYSKLENAYWFKYLKGQVGSSFPQPIKKSVKESEVAVESPYFIYAWILNNLQNINAIKIDERLKEKARQVSEYISQLLNKLLNSYCFQCFKGYFLTGLPQPITEVVIDIKESEAFEDAHNFILSWFWNPIRSINITEIKERLPKYLTELTESDAFKRPVQFFMTYFLDGCKQFIRKFCICHDELLNGEIVGQQRWYEMPFSKKVLWFGIGFASCFVTMYVYDYVIQLKEEFDTFEEYLEAVKDQKYPLDEKNKKSRIHNQIKDEDVDRDKNQDVTTDTEQDFYNMNDESITDED